MSKEGYQLSFVTRVTLKWLIVMTFFVAVTMLGVMYSTGKSFGQLFDEISCPPDFHLNADGSECVQNLSDVQVDMTPVENKPLGTAEGAYQAIVVTPKAEEPLIAEANILRAGYGAKPLAYSKNLSVYAQARGVYLCNSEFTHDGWREFVKDIPGSVAENIARNFPTPQEAGQAFASSTEHAANIVNTAFVSMGFADVDCGKVNEFGTERVIVEIFADHID